MNKNIGKIYIITNDTNDLVYIGQTVHSIGDRFKQHIYMAKSFSRKAKLYKAMQDIKEEHFKIELLTECNIVDTNNLEVKYIKQYDSYHNGYNSTPGGDNGKSIFMNLNIDSFIEDYNTGITIVDMANKYGCSAKTISEIRKTLSIESNRDTSHNNGRPTKKQIIKYDKYFNPIKLYSAVSDAIKEHKGTTYWYYYIGQACKCGNIAYGHRWQSLEELEEIIEGKVVHFNTIYDKQLYKSNRGIELIDKRGLLKCKNMDYAAYVGESARETCGVCGSKLDTRNKCINCEIKSTKERSGENHSDTVKAIMELASSGLSLLEMGRRVSMSGNGVKKICVKNNIEYRTKYSRKACEAYNRLTGEVINFKSAGEAADQMLLTGRANSTKWDVMYAIKRAIEQNRTAYNYTWKYIR